MQRLTIGLAAALALAAGGARADGKLTISKGVADDFATYQASIGAVGSGIYAVTEDGQGGASAGCRTETCTNKSKAADLAIAKCEKLNPGQHCIIFARDRDPVIDYVVGQ